MKVALFIALICLAVIQISSCESANAKSAAVTGGNPWAGKDKIAYYGCGSCHTIPGVRGANALVGPSLERIGSRVYVAGVLPNTPTNMARWIQNAPSVDHLTAMPNLNVTPADARDITAYLYTLK